MFLLRNDEDLFAFFSDFVNVMWPPQAIRNVYTKIGRSVDSLKLCIVKVVFIEWLLALPSYV